MSVPLKRLATVIAGQSPASDEVSPLGDGLPFIQGNAEFGARSPSPRFQCANAPKKAALGDVLISVRAPVGEVNVATGELGIGRGVAAVRPLGINADYLYWFLQHSRAELTSLSTGSTFAAVTASDVGNLLVPVLGYAGQTRIADYLDRETATIDTLIEKQRTLVRRLHERRAAVVDLAFGEANDYLLPLKRALVKNDSGVWGDKPSGAGDTVVLRSTEQTVDGYWTLSDPAERSLSGSERKAALLGAGDLIVTKTSGSPKHIGKATLVDPEMAKQGYAFGNFMQRLRTTPALQAEFLWWYLRTDRARRWINLVATTSTGLMNLNGRTLGEMSVPIPPLDEQRAIADHLDAETAKIDALIAKAERFIELAQERRAALITAAVTGQIEIPEAGAAA